MKKILLAFDGTHFSEGAFEFARHLNEKQPILLTSLFLPLTDYSSLWSYSAASGGALFIPLIEREESEVIKKNIEHFEKLCIKNNIDYRIHKDFFDFALPELKKETRFADLLILGSESFYENIGKHDPNEYLEDALKEAECPVLVVPEKFVFPDNNVLTFNGSESSIYAIKQFAYLFPELSTNKTMLVYINEEEKDIPDEAYIKELLPKHFSDLSIVKMTLDRKNDFVTWINEKKGSLLVTGSFGRSFLSQLFKKSFISDIIQEHKIPVFMAHNK